MIRFIETWLRSDAVIADIHPSIKELQNKGKKQGYLTYDDLNEALPDA